MPPGLLAIVDVAPEALPCPCLLELRINAVQVLGAQAALAHVRDALAQPLVQGSRLSRNKSG
eukprot:14279693-Alexandrium_andersonii.AAC.1